MAQIYDNVELIPIVSDQLTNWGIQVDCICIYSDSESNIHMKATYSVRLCLPEKLFSECVEIERLIRACNKHNNKETQEGN